MSKQKVKTVSTLRVALPKANFTSFVSEMVSQLSAEAPCYRYRNVLGYLLWLSTNNKDKKYIA